MVARPVLCLRVKDFELKGQDLLVQPHPQAFWLDAIDHGE